MKEVKMDDAHRDRMERDERDRREQRWGRAAVPREPRMYLPRTDVLDSYTDAKFDEMFM